MSYSPWFKEILRCPQTGEPLRFNGAGFLRSDGKFYPIIDGILSIVYPEQLGGQEEELHQFYERIAPFYDATERFLGKLLTGVDVVEGRKKIVSLLGVKPGMKLLEVSPGPGVFQPLLRELLREEGEIVALDLSLNMLRQCQIRNKDLRVQLVRGNAHYLPFADESFDAVFHFGGVNLFAEPERAIQEFVRVAKKQGIVSWGDEGFSPNYPDSWRKKILTKINPGFLKPRPSLPPQLTEVQEYEVYGGLAYLVVGRKS